MTVQYVEGMNDANGRPLCLGQRVECTDEHGNKRIGYVHKLEPSKGRCGGDEGDVLVHCKGEDIWTVPSDVVVLMLDDNGKQIKIGNRVRVYSCVTDYEEWAAEPKLVCGVVTGFEYDESEVLGVLYDFTIVCIRCDNGTELKQSIDCDIEILDA